MDLQSFKALYAENPKNYPYVFERRYKAVLDRIIMLWDMPIECVALFGQLASASHDIQSGFSPDAKHDLGNLIEVYKKWRAEQRPKANISTLNFLSKGALPGIIDAQKAPTPDVLDAMRLAFELVAADSPKTADLFKLKGLNPNQRDLEGASALMRACQLGKETAAMALIKAGANPHLADSMGNTSLHWAVIQNKRRMVEMLLYFGAEPNTPNSAGASPFSLSVVKDDSTIAQRLFEYGADIASQDNAGNTPLHKAITAGSIESVWLLLVAGALESARNKAGITPFELAEKSPEIKRIFDKHNVQKRKAPF